MICSRSDLLAASRSLCVQLDEIEDGEQARHRDLRAVLVTVESIQRWQVGRTLPLATQ